MSFLWKAIIFILKFLLNILLWPVKTVINCVITVLVFLLIVAAIILYFYYNKDSLSPDLFQDIIFFLRTKIEKYFLSR